MDISIVIPALNESGKICFDVEAAAIFLKKQGFLGEVIVVDDGSRDGTAEEVRKASLPSSVELEIIRLKRNSGKGAAVKTGIEKSKGEVVIFADSGTCVPYENALRSIVRIRAGELDMAMASRRLKETVIRRNRSLKRRILSWLFRLAARAAVGIPRRFTDTQCGFKVYKGEVARELFAACITRGFLFELEVLLRALERGYRVEEFPVEWTCDLDSRLRPGRVAYNVTRDLIKIRKILFKK
jgi:dolichyl-phosphate beta-glucosyltransferase